jgi:hypothetical protein
MLYILFLNDPLLVIVYLKLLRYHSQLENKLIVPNNRHKYDVT